MPERAIQQDLPRGAHEQIRPTHDFRDLHLRIIHHARELISRNVIIAPDHEVAEIFARDKSLFAEIFIMKGDAFTIRNAETPGK